MWKRIDGRKMRVGLLLLALAFIGYQYVHVRHTVFPQARYIPSQGIAENETHGKVPGNPARELSDARRLYFYIQIYCKGHDGKYPSNSGVMVEDMILHARNYGVGIGMTGMQRYLTIRNFAFSFNNPDFKYADNPSLRNLHGSASVPFIIYDKRPNGSAVGGPKPPGTRDVLAFTDLYYHRNVRHFKGDITTFHPVGFFIVLWDDGAVQKIPYNKIRCVPEGDS